MKTYMANPDKIERKWYVVDAEGATLGRLASEIAKVLRGKNKPESLTRTIFPRCSVRHSECLRRTLSRHHPPNDPSITIR